METFQSVPKLTDHAALRSAQRNFSVDEIEFIVFRGSKLHNAGAIFFQLRAKDVPVEVSPNHRFWRLVGSTVVVSKCGRYVLTVYKNAKAYRRNRRKPKYDYRKRDNQIAA